MPAPLVPDAEFVELWRTHKSAAKVAAILGMPDRKVLERRRRIEQRLNVRLDATDSRAVHYKHLHPTVYPEARPWSIDSGVVMVFSDAHFLEGARTTAFRGFVKLCRELSPKAIINNGDAFDGANISRHPPIGWTNVPSVLSELKATQDGLEIISDAAPKAKKFWNIGNHDERYENRLASNVPQFAGVEGMRLTDRFPEWDMGYSLWINDDAVALHSYRNGVHATRNNALNSGRTTITGHTHSLKVTPLSDWNGDRWGVDTGMLADQRGPQFMYRRGTPSDWRSGFVVLTWHKGRLLWPEVVHVVDEGVVSFRGQLIKV